jgi:mRNA-degrading endonuclease RelE of RelBE toxin-antitoxin system
LDFGDYRILSDVVDENHSVLILGIVHRKDLQEWLRQDR